MNRFNKKRIWLGVVLCVCLLIVLWGRNMVKLHAVQAEVTPFSEGTTTTYPYDFTGKSTGWTIIETAEKVAKSTGAEYILMLDKADKESVKSIGVRPEVLKEYVGEYECMTIEVDSDTRYILMPDQVKQLREIVNSQ